MMTSELGSQTLSDNRGQRMMEMMTQVDCAKAVQSHWLLGVPGGCAICDVNMIRYFKVQRTNSQQQNAAAKFANAKFRPVRFNN
jgi:hypothetical protein